MRPRNNSNDSNRLTSQSKYTNGCCDYTEQEYSNEKSQAQPISSLASRMLTTPKQDTFPKLSPTSNMSQYPNYPFETPTQAQDRPYQPYTAQPPAQPNLNPYSNPSQPSQISLLTQQLTKEISVTKILEEKCEEYLHQLKRSADIIERDKLNQHKLNSEIEALVLGADKKKEELELVKAKNEDLRRELEGAKKEVEEAKREIERREREIKAERERVRELGVFEGEVGRVREEVVRIKGEKAGLEAQLKESLKVNEMLERELKSKDSSLSRYDSKEDSYKQQLEQSIDRINDLKEENSVLRQDKDKLFGKVDHLLNENENLRNEVYMLKKIMLEVEKRDFQNVSSMMEKYMSKGSNGQNHEEFPPSEEQRGSTEENRNDYNHHHRGRGIGERPDRPSRSPISQARGYFGMKDSLTPNKSNKEVT